MRPAPPDFFPEAGFNRTAKQPTVLTFNNAGKQKQFVIKPFVAVTLIAVICAVILSVLSSASYLFLRDDIVSATLSRHARMQHAYEDRITALRAQVDLVTSRQLLDQQAVESRVSELMARQQKIGAMQKQADKVFKRAGSLRKQTRNIYKVPKPTLDTTRLDTGGKGKLRLGALVGSSNPFANSQPKLDRFDVAGGTDTLFDTVEASLEETEKAQLAELIDLKKNADRKAAKLASILGKQGIRLPKDTGVGGPLIELKSGNSFAASINALDASLETLELVRKAAKSLPHGSPAPGQRISSRFGSRRDPFTGKRAVHGGLDFKARTGSKVIATASGKVTKAGRLGGYGKLVEIDHGGGITTRYAHLSRIKVRVGQWVKRGARIGNVGSTGRSTGPHLHYEVRRRGRVLDPIHYVRLAKYIKPYL